MLVNGNNISSKDKVPEIPVCNKTELLVRDGRNYVRFLAELSRELDASEGEQQSAKENSEGQGGVDLLLQLL